MHTGAQFELAPVQGLDDGSYTAYVNLLRL